MLKGCEGYVYGSKLRAEDDVVLVDACGVDEYSCVCGFVYDGGAHLGVGVYFRSVSVNPGIRVPHWCPRGCGWGCV